jgi:hypothetical protein
MPIVRAVLPMGEIIHALVSFGPCSCGMNLLLTCCLLSPPYRFLLLDGPAVSVLGPFWELLLIYYSIHAYCHSVPK